MAKGKKKKRGKHSMQPVVWDGKGVIRFQENPIVRFILDNGPHDMNTIARASAEQRWTRADHSHFAQLTGYSVSGWSGLGYVSDREFDRADKRRQKVLATAPDDPALANASGPAVTK